MSSRISARTAPTQAYVAALKRDVCVYCNGPGGTRDHIVPIRHPSKTFRCRQRRGRSTWHNLAGACDRCNVEKGDTMLLAFLISRAARGAGGFHRPAPLKDRASDNRSFRTLTGLTTPTQRGVDTASHHLVAEADTSLY